MVFGKASSLISAQDNAAEVNTGMGKEIIFRNEIKSLVTQIKKNYKPQKIILFGSSAKGNMKTYSDIDMLIVKKTKRRFIDRISDVLLRCEYTLPFEPIVYTPAEIKKRLKAGDFFIKEIIHRGKVLYGG